MSKLTELMAEATKILAKDLGKTEKEVLSEYSSKYGTGLADKLLEDSKVLSKEASSYKEVPADKALTTIVSGPAVPVGDAKVSSDFTKGKPIGAVSSPAASGRADKALVTSGPLTEVVSKGQLALPPPPKGIGPTIEAPFQESPAIGASGRMEASSAKTKSKTVPAIAATGAIAAGSGAYVNSKGEEKPAPEAPLPPKEVAKKITNKQVSKSVENAGKAKTPADFESVLNSFKDSLEQVPQEERDAFQAKLDKLDESLLAAQGKYEQDKNRTEWMEVAEKLGFAFAQIGAGMHGLNTGVDVSGIKFNPTNWEARYDRSLNELKNTSAGIQKGIENVRDDKKDRESSVDKKNEATKRSLFEDYLNTKKINADLQQTKMRLDSDLQIARMNQDTKAIKEVEKEKEEVAKGVDKRMKILQEIKADLQAASDKELDKSVREQAKKNFADNLRKLGKDKLLAQIRETADDASWYDSDFGDKAVMKLIDKEMEDVGNIFAPPKNAGPGTTSGVVYIQAPDGSIAPVQASQVDKYVNKGGKVVSGPGGN